MEQVPIHELEDGEALLSMLRLTVYNRRHVSAHERLNRRRVSACELLNRRHVSAHKLLNRRHVSAHELLNRRHVSAHELLTVVVHHVFVEWSTRASGEVVYMVHCTYAGDTIFAWC